MKKLLTIFTICLIGLLSFSCSMMDDIDDLKAYNPSYYVSYGELQEDAEGNRIKEIDLDDGTRLLISEMLISSEDFAKAKKRICFNYTILNKAEELSSIPGGYYIRLNSIYDMLYKPVLQQSDLDKDPILADSVGNDPIQVVEATISGHYLNLKLKVEDDGTNRELHFINLVYDNKVENATNNVTLSLRHHRYNGTSKGNYGYVLASFDMWEFIPMNDTSTEIVLKWPWYDNSGNLIEYSDSGVFNPYFKLGDTPVEDSYLYSTVSYK